MKKIRFSTLLRQFLRRLFHPAHFMEFLKLQFRKKKIERVEEDAQLSLYAKIIPGDFLHLGYFDNPDAEAEAISLRDIRNAQIRYAELLIEKIEDKTHQVLDVGCGMGGLIGLLESKQLQAVGLTPDRAQILYLKKNYPRTTVIHSRFEELPGEAYAQRFGTVITSESLQYLNIEQSASLIHKILLPGGRWILCDFLSNEPTAKNPVLNWKTLPEVFESKRFKIVSTLNITPNIVPTLRFAHLLGERIGLPLFEFIVSKLKHKEPGVYYLLQDSFSDIHHFLSENLSVVDPHLFLKEKSYRLMVVDKT